MTPGRSPGGESGTQDGEHDGGGDDGVADPSVGTGVDLAGELAHIGDEEQGADGEPEQAGGISLTVQAPRGAAAMPPTSMAITVATSMLSPPSEVRRVPAATMATATSAVLTDPMA